MGLGALVDVAVSILAVMVLFTLAATAINEAIGDNLLRLRARTLEQGLRALLEHRHLKALAARYRREGATGVAEDAPVAEGEREAILRWATGKFYDDPDIRALMRGGRKPSAIEPRRYALTVLNLIERRDELEKAAAAQIEKHRADTLAAIRETADALGAGGHGAALAAHADRAFAATLGAVGDAASELDRAVAALEKEFDETMDRVSGWYLRKVRLMSFCIGLVLAVGANVDFLRYADRLLTEAALRDRAASMATLLADDEMLQAYSAALREERAARAQGGGVVQGAGDAPTRAGAGAGAIPAIGGAGAADEALDAEIGRRVGALMDGLGGLEIQVGWDCLSHEVDAPILTTLGCGDGAGFAAPSVSEVIGWFLVAFGVTLGAQFWFDLLKRIAALRTSGVVTPPAERRAQID
ncbi:hypothetical protein [Rubrimonas cliftonensis]|uniref:Uncharacterized protein n=1 Tax=Rubrimonas cliftonensis TaxID=89524 RepID=A0A1H3VFX8_9RHOB|nr:hypothetical protein [Rubrimonas cliftonensis]SDZ73717.1 hypothetical protein SAMN05444370_10167 [Rubrimonas cliftonensis]